RVTNLRPYLDKKYQDMTLPEFRDILLTRLFGVDDVAEIKDKEYHVTDTDRVEIKKIYDDVYNNWDWVYGHSPEFTTKKRKHFDYGTIDA
ncbi:MAG TPA: lipoate--protein ligase, partial [Lactobacillus sp.]|nr:lipoate--protein ligase [Lactobacillus sp.]